MMVDRDIALSCKSKKKSNSLFIVRYAISRAVWFTDSYTEEAELEAAKIKKLSFSLEESVR